MMQTMLIMKEGSETSEGRNHLISNINACISVGETIRTTLGPRGMDKLIVDSKGKATISNDGATVMNLLEVTHPAARSLVEIAQSQDNEVGDGTTTVVLLACEMLSNMKKLIEDGIHPTILVRTIRKTCQLAIEKIKNLSIKKGKDIEESADWRQTLERCALTSLNSKLIASHKTHFAKLVVDAVLLLGDERINMIGIKKIPGGSVSDSWLVRGIAFKKAFSYAGFEMQPKKYSNWPKIALLNIELELKAERDNAEIRLKTVQVIEAEWTILYQKLQKLHEMNVKIVLSRLPIGDVATQYFADRDMFCAGRIPEDDMKRTMTACGGSIVTTLDGIPESVLGTCEVFEEKQIGNDRFNIFLGCPKARACTFILRGGAAEFMEETERSLHDAIMIVRRTVQNDEIVAGGGAIDMEIARYLHDYSRSVAGKEQIIIRSYGKSFEVIPRQLCNNAGFDSINVLNKLRQKHSERYCTLTIVFNEYPSNCVTANLELMHLGRCVIQKHGNITEPFVMNYMVDGKLSYGKQELQISFFDASSKELNKHIFSTSLSYIDTNKAVESEIAFKEKNIKASISQSFSSESQWFGVNINREDISNNMEAAVWEPSLIKINSILAATEAVCSVLSVDHTIRAPSSSAEHAA